MTIPTVILTGAEPSRFVAMMLALFLGGLGIHKFYLGKTGLGVAYLVFCWTLIPAMIGFIDFILLAAMPPAEFARKYGSRPAFTAS